MSTDAPSKSSGSSAAGTVAAGIFSSRIIGFVRESVIAYFFGVSAYADVWRLALRGPNVLQNLLGEGTLSAAFIPIYSRMVEEGREDDAGKLAGAILGLLIIAALVFVLAGILLAGPLVTILSPGYVNDPEQFAAGKIAVDRFTLSVEAVRIVFPMAGILVLSAWALGVLNSHRKFFLPYFAPVLWSMAIIASLFAGGYFLVGRTGAMAGPQAMTDGSLQALLMYAFFGALIGAVLQLLIQLPGVFRVIKGFRLSFSLKVLGVREALKAFGPVLAGRGVYQISGYLDLFLASFLAVGALSALGYAQVLYMLPVSLFGMSVAASELPELSRLGHEQGDAFVQRMNRSIGQMLFLTVPTVVGYLLFGYLIVGAIFRRGGFDRGDTLLVYLVLAAYALGVVATTMSRLLQNAFYALNDTRTPAKTAVLRVVASTIIAVPLMFLLDRFTVGQVTGLATGGGEPLRLGAVGLALGATFGGWVELERLRRVLRKKADRFHLPWARLFRMVGLALVSTVPGIGLWWLLQGWHTTILMLLSVGVYAIVYLALSHFTGTPEMEAWSGRLLSRFRRK